jgi:RNA polymerase sigma-70 factor, ECF subfamily
MQPSDDFADKYQRSISETYERGGAARWALPQSTLLRALGESVRSWSAKFAAAPSVSEVEAYLAALNAEDLALACACRIGVEPAWQYFIEQYRPMLYDAARRLARDEARAHELADSLFAELYGLEERRGERRSLLAYFHGRSTLKTWLRAVLAQRYVDSTRGAQRLEPLTAETADKISAADDPPDPERGRYVDSFTQALNSALEALKPRDRMRLNFHYVEDLRLKEIGRLMGEHESTVSRRLARSRAQLRRQVERALRRGARLNDEQIRLCYDYAMESYAVDLGRILGGSR